MLLACCSLLEVPQARLAIAAAGTIASLFGGSQRVALQLADFSTHVANTSIDVRYALLTRNCTIGCTMSNQRPADPEPSSSV